MLEIGRGARPVPRLDGATEGDATSALTDVAGYTCADRPEHLPRRTPRSPRRYKPI